MLLRKEKPLMLFGLDIWQSSYKGLWLFFGVYLFATLVASVFTPPVYWFFIWYDKTFPSDTTAWLVGKGVDVFYDRIRWIPIVASLPWVLKKCGLLSLKNLGLSPDFANLKKFLAYFAAGITLEVLMLSAQIAFTDIRPDPEATCDSIITAIISGFLGALLLSFLEELVFRALILRCFYTAWGACAGILFSSLFFAYKHFKVPGSIWQNMDVHSTSWNSGFLVAYYDTMGVFMTFDAMKFATLTMFGMTLSAMYLYTRSLGSAIGFHAGIVWMILSFRSALNNHNTEETMRIFASMGLSDGWLALILLTFMFAGFVIALRRRQKLKLDNR